MSHVANLRARQQASLPAKRRKLSTEHVELNGVNGLLNGSVPLNATPTKNAKPTNATDDSLARVGNGQVDTEMLEDSEEDEDDEDESESGSGDEPEQETEVQPPSQAEEPSFGELIRQRGQEPINVDLSTDALALKSSSKPSQTRALSIPNATSLGTVLTQALRTNDVDLLESCLQVSNLESIRATIERLHSSLAASLLQKLAERMHKKPGRAGSLMVWIQWTIVAHGGHLAGQQSAMKELHTLYQVVRQRASGLQHLLALKGKLDMLEAQMQLRRNMQRRSAKAEDEGVIYVEGEESSDGGVIVDDVGVDSSEDEELEDLPNGFAGAEDDDIEEDDLDEDDEEDEEASDDDDDLIDDEAEESEDDSDEDVEDEDEIDYDAEDAVEL